MLFTVVFIIIIICYRYKNRWSIFGSKIEKSIYKSIHIKIQKYSSIPRGILKSIRI